jgi:hypothetical protein
MVREQIRRDASPALAATYQQAAPMELMYAGYERYWSKRGPRAGWAEG